MNKTILVIDDEDNIRELIKFNLEIEGYSVLTAADGEQGLKLVEQRKIDLIILDLMLPQIDGLTLCSTIRSRDRVKHLPIIMLTARGEEVDRIIGLEMGADDYMVKPFSPRELAARVKAVLRRATPAEGVQEKNKVLRQGRISLDISSHEVRADGNLLDLTPKEFELLKYLLINSNRVLTRDLLLEKIWGYDYPGDTRTVDVHIRRLRKKIGEGLISTVRGVGYKFVTQQ